ncbi:UDP-N-acetylmuramyl tripeptide synthase [endosymbiont of Sipalinus gigas]|uniref:UDP-N-acetylmuramoyl-L-alanyl-D-glutamate--2, 6-diaminopimelate ligase n=1 Tax=endosymbiont of Sipalinus gigas TaxID=1972134 RepID=UPI000DC6F822|nr:UDP-N-acetylmuramoyl-L-alanyl-D-glutamate--2,6-diaminopimelate ligase [endosymbiont of Sipalinus gigas]BBA85173.1 UDP-N-acetylmuramyl tripeptide synthase [endosymbiont of Sipalinus gigas]
MKNFRIRKLLSKWIDNRIPDILISNIVLDSRLVNFNCAFFAVIGYKNDGRKYINKAISKGASIIISETDDINLHNKINFINNICIVLFYLLRNNLSEIAGLFYNNPCKKTNIICITGTNGKTTITFLTSQLLKLLNKNCSLIGTLGNGKYDNLIKTECTTDSPFDIYKEIYNKVKEKNEFILIEASSHSLYQNRIKNLNIKLAVFTNISHEHLDFHKNMKNYKESKLKLFKDHNVNFSIINYDNEFGKYLYNLLKDKCYILTYNKNVFKEKVLKIINIKIFKENSIIIFEKDSNIYKLDSKFCEIFNINNLLISLLILNFFKFPMENTLKLVNFLKLPCGRLNSTKYNDVEIIVDYAHTPDSFNKVLKSIKNRCINNLWCIFGCGGEKDKKKRKIMAKIVNKYSNFSIITTDNPRNEEINNIVNDIKKGFNKSNYKVILDREDAIRYSIKNSYKNDIILILGKGHEDYQIIKNKKIFYSDIHLVKKIVKCLN